MIHIFLNIRFAILTILIGTVTLFTACKEVSYKKDFKIESQTDIKLNPTKTGIQQYTCPMHPQIIKEKPGDCPICGMTLVKKEVDSKKIDSVQLTDLLRSTNQYVVSSIPVTTIKIDNPENELEVLGVTDYDTRLFGSISAKVSGRIQRLYIKSTFQNINKGEKVMDIYSPQLSTAEGDLLFLIKNDPANTSLIFTAKQKLLLLGVSAGQIQEILSNGRISNTISVYSNYSGHVHDLANMPGITNNLNIVTPELNVKEGMYVEKGQPIFSVYNPKKITALLDIYPEQQTYVKVGTQVRIVPENKMENSIDGRIDFIEPFLRPGSKTLKARVYFSNEKMEIPVGSQVKAKILNKNKLGYWLPREAVISLGTKKIVFLKASGGFQSHTIETGISLNNKIEILNGLTVKDSVAANAQYLMDPESIIKTK